jgi:putative Ca2+/H+ antiporter (TMEM165/GDT1 family)
MAWGTFLSTFGVVFLAELGDKTQIASMTLATRHPWPKVFFGAAGAFLLLNVLAVAVGGLLFRWVPLAWVQLASAALFLWLGVASLRDKDDDDDDQEDADKVRASRGPLLTTFLLILLAELGDKTQIATATLAAQLSSPVMVFLGSTAALWAVTLLGVLVGARLLRVLPKTWLHRAAGLVFLVFGAMAAYRGISSLLG